jgi:hypothetical protein
MLPVFAFFIFRISFTVIVQSQSGEGKPSPTSKTDNFAKMQYIKNHLNNWEFYSIAESGLESFLKFQLDAPVYWRHRIVDQSQLMKHSYALHFNFNKFI